tara:strand:+ start:16752 stop:17675 length:924 start_codon:yes stop_codon:yes gene_type:complete
MDGSLYNQLTVFHTVADTGGFNAAARKLEISAPSVSQAIRSLEQTLGLPVFTRSTRRVELTETGRQLRADTRGPMDQLAHAIELTKSQSMHARGTVRITVPRFAYEFLIKPNLNEFCLRYPDVTLEVALADAVVDIVEEGFDLGIRFGDRVKDSMVAMELEPKMREALFVSPEYANTRGVPRNLKELAEHRLIDYRFISSNTLAPLRLRSDNEVIDVKLQSALVVNDTGAMVDAALAGVGIGRLVLPGVQPLLESGDLVPVLEDHWFTYPGLYLYFTQKSQNALRVRALIDFLREKARGRRERQSLD